MITQAGVQKNKTLGSEMVYWHRNSPVGHTTVLQNIERPFKDKAEAEKYIQGRIKAYSHLFTEISPPIPKEYEKILYGTMNIFYPICYRENAKAQEAAKTENISRSADKKPSIRAS